jgi:hypothetical protein
MSLLPQRRKILLHTDLRPEAGTHRTPCPASMMAVPSRPCLGPSCAVALDAPAFGGALLFRGAGPLQQTVATGTVEHLCADLHF